MPIACPNCASRNLRYSRTRNSTERFWRWTGVRPLRCRDCHCRFVDRTWNISDLRYARCPKCWRMDLSLWDEKDWHVGTFMSLQLRMGAKPYRCEYCRVNFVSFRLRHERFSFNRWQKMRQAAEREASRRPTVAK